jgi:phage terminase large subunit
LAEDLRFRLPANGWQPRPYQKALWEFLCYNGKRAIAIHHRRAGKDEIGLHYCAFAMHERVCNVWYALPEYAQARKAIWNAINPHTGRRRIDEAFPLELRETTNDSEMMIRTLNKSTFQLVGSDQYNRQVGSSVAGIVFSEWALANPSAWAYLRPILDENNGWALFITTPRGRNHAYDMFRHAQRTPGWFSEILTARDTGAFTAEQLDNTLAEYCALYGVDTGTAQYEQEYGCSFVASVIGSFYAHEMAQVRADDRVRDDVVALPDHYVHRSWDLGIRDDCAVFFWQVAGAQIRVLDCYSISSVSLERHAEMVFDRHKKYGWKLGSDYVPHDAKVRDIGTGKTRVETMRQLGLRPMLSTDATMQDGINALRRMLPLCVFHPRCEPGLAALEQYRREWDDDLKTFKASPLHDGNSHYADSARYMALSWRQAPAREIKRPVETGWHISPPSEPRRGGVVL